MKKHFKLLPHQTITQNFENIYSLTGSMQLFGIFKYSRNMVILKEGNKLCLVNPVRLNEAEEEKLLNMGTIYSVLKLGRLHSVDVPYYMEKFSPKLWTSSKDSFVQSRNYNIDIDLEKNNSLPFMNMQIYSFKTSKENEAVAFLPQNNGILLSCDALVNMKKVDPMANWLVRTLSKLLPEPTYIGPNWYKAMKPLRRDFHKVLEFKFDKMIPAHGSVLKDNASKKISLYLESFEFKFN